MTPIGRDQLRDAAIAQQCDRFLASLVRQSGAAQELDIGLEHHALQIVGEGRDVAGADGFDQRFRKSFVAREGHVEVELHSRAEHGRGGQHDKLAEPARKLRLGTQHVAEPDHQLAEFGELQPGVVEIGQPLGIRAASIEAARAERQLVPQLALIGVQLRLLQDRKSLHRPRISPDAASVFESRGRVN